jgi:hypothetical protein
LLFHPVILKNFGFDLIQLATADNYDIFTAKVGQSAASLKGRIFRDLYVADTPARAWLESAGNPPHLRT